MRSYELPGIRASRTELFGTLWIRATRWLARASAIGLFSLSLGPADGVAQKNEPAPSLREPKDASVRDRERQAMIEFYQALGGPDWIEREFWGSDRPVGNGMA